MVQFCDAHNNRVSFVVGALQLFDLNFFRNCLIYVFIFVSFYRFGDIVPVTNAGQIMTIVLMLTGTFYLAMPLTAAASTFYGIHEAYYEKQKAAKISAAAGAAAAVVNGSGSNGANHTPFATGAGAGAGSGANSNNSNGLTTTTTALVNPASYGDYLDRRLQKRVTVMLGELFLLQSAISDFFTDLQQVSSDFNDERHIKEQGLERNGYLEVNNRKMPVLKKITSSFESKPHTAELASSAADNNSNNNNNNAPGGQKSAMLKQLQKILAKLDGLLSGSEDDVLRVVVLHHKLRKNF